ncbi:MAG TPA: hypothetical protein H9814_09720 [Candidatus Bacteroides merdigallinarum]|uniref:DUF6562 domain-containing protein n=1 Tax=Candidatus Bacteroides merdigallinarum TaxID=2838473 RepID=A0A9D2EAF1_9BACE|nr:hypothetical protein [Candidatus Bacteroides merdigallinarum]
MKKVLSLLAFSAVMFAGCQEDWEAQQEGTGEESMVRITLQTPEAMGMTRAGAGYTNSAKGGITNVDWTKYDLRYQVAVYDKDGNNQVVTPILKTVQGDYAGTEFEVRLVNKREYKFVAWADFVKVGTTADLHYDTDDLTAITCLDAVSGQLNDESRDAYFVTENQTVDASKGISLTLRRPFAKVRVVTTDWDENGTYMPDNFKVTYYNCKRFTSLNAVTGVATGSDLSTTVGDVEDVYTAKFASKTDKDYSEGYEAESVKNRTLTVDYLLANTNQDKIHFKLESLDGENPVSTYDFTTDIPIQRNYLTTILGNLLTENAKVQVTCDENFEDQITILESWWDPKTFGEMKEPMIETSPDGKTKTYHVKTIAELAWLSENAKGAETPWYKNVRNVVLDNDLDLNGINWKPIAIWQPEPTVTFDGGNHTISNVRINSWNGTNQAGVGFFGDPTNSGYVATLNIKNLTLDNVVINGVSSWSGALAGNFYGDVENCTVKHVFIHNNDYNIDSNPTVIRIGGMIGVHNSGSIKNCHAEDINIKGFHSIGALIGSVAHEANITYENCSVDGASLWVTAPSGVGQKQIGSIVGVNVGTKTVTLKDCSSSNMEYKVGPYDEENGTPYILVSGEEGTKDYGPQHALYGNKPDNITVEDSTSNSEP